MSIPEEVQSVWTQPCVINATAVAESFELVHDAAKLVIGAKVADLDKKVPPLPVLPIDVLRREFFRRIGCFDSPVPLCVDPEMLVKKYRDFLTECIEWYNDVSEVWEVTFMSSTFTCDCEIQAGLDTMLKSFMCGLTKHLSEMNVEKCGTILTMCFNQGISLTYDKEYNQVVISSVSGEQSDDEALEKKISAGNEKGYIDFRKLRGSYVLRKKQGIQIGSTMEECRGGICGLDVDYDMPLEWSKYKQPVLPQPPIGY